MGLHFECYAVKEEKRKFDGCRSTRVFGTVSEVKCSNIAMSRIV